MRLLSKLKIIIPIVLLLLLTILLHNSLNSPNRLLNPDAESVGGPSKKNAKDQLAAPITQPVNGSQRPKPWSLLGPSYHALQRRAIRLVRESRYLVQAKLRAWHEQPPAGSAFAKELDELHRVFSGLTDLLEVNIDGLSRVDGAGLAHRNALQSLSDAFNQELHKLQNPEDCSNARHLLVDINKACGLGCKLHHAGHCFRLAIGSGRILQFTSSKFAYSDNGFFSVFKPLSSCSIDTAEAKLQAVVWGSPGYESSKYVFCPIIEALPEIPEYAHPAVPASIAAALKHLHGEPPVWVSGHLLAYLMRFQPGNISIEMNKLIQNVRGFPQRQPIVGIHIRRTDKIQTEAALHKLEEYMKYVDQYYEKLELERTMRARSEEWRGDDVSFPLPQQLTRRVFIATDDPEVLSEARRLYGSQVMADGRPLYKFVGDEQRAQSAALQTRYTDGSFHAIVADLIGLSHTDFLVCTFSSQIGRLAYELMQTHAMELGDASTKAQSLDDTYYYGGQQSWHHEVLVSHKAAGLSAGDHVSYLGNHWDGYAKVKLPKTQLDLVLPAYLFENTFRVVDFPGFRVNVSLT